MSKLRLLLVSILLLSIQIVSQEKVSLQLNAGLIHPDNYSSGGPVTTAQLSFQLNKNVNIYLTTGYSTWGPKVYNYNYIMKNFSEPGEISELVYSGTFKESVHNLIPLTFGTRILGSENKYFSGFIEAEIGISFVQYNSDGLSVIDTSSFHFNPILLSQFSEKKNKIFPTVGIGIGAFRQFGEYGNIVVCYKIFYVKDDDKYESAIHRYYSSFTIGYDFMI